MNSFFTYDSVKTPIFLDLVKSTEQMKLFVNCIDKFHSYKKFKHSPTRNIRYLVYEGASGNHIGAVGLSSATIAVACRDKFIGWTGDVKMIHLNKLANNSRYCMISDNITIKNAASMTLKHLRVQGAKDWKSRYGDELILIETFVQPEREGEYKGNTNRNGSVYRADNWIDVGMTAGVSIQKSPLLLWAKEKGERGRLARENKKECLEIYGKYLGEHNGSGYKVTESKKKIVFVKPLVHNWKKILTTP